MKKHELRFGMQYIQNSICECPYLKMVAANTIRMCMPKQDKSPNLKYTAYVVAFSTIEQHFGGSISCQRNIWEVMVF